VKPAKAAEVQAALFSTLSSVSRVRIMQLLSNDTLCVGALSRSTGISAGAVSQHLRILHSAGLVEPERRGYYIHYRRAPGAAARLKTALAVVLSPEKGTTPCVPRDRCAGSRRT
jgi:DNA-binding transcriptional ArsR family regulator